MYNNSGTRPNLKTPRQPINYCYRQEAVVVLCMRWYTFILEVTARSKC